MSISDFIVTEQIIMSIGSIFAFAIVGKLATGRLIAAIEAHRKDVQDHIDHAQSLKKEAQELLKGYREQYKDLSTSTSEIIAKSKGDAERIVEQARVSARHNAALKLESAKQKINSNCENLIQDFERKFADVLFDSIKQESLKNKELSSNSPITCEHIDQHIKDAKIWH